MSSTELYIDDELLIFSGQSTVDTWVLKDELCVSGTARYDSWLVREIAMELGMLDSGEWERPCMERALDITIEF